MRSTLPVENSSSMDFAGPFLGNRAVFSGADTSSWQHKRGGFVESDSKMRMVVYNNVG